MDITKIYGIEFDETIPQGSEKRIFHAEGMRNDYVVGSSFRFGGCNDFDSAYPFGAMRRCNVFVNSSAKIVTYKGEPRVFSRRWER